MQELQVYVSVIGFYVGRRDLISGPHTAEQVPLAISPVPQPYILFACTIAPMFTVLQTPRITTKAYKAMHIKKTRKYKVLCSNLINIHMLCAKLLTNSNPEHPSGKFGPSIVSGAHPFFQRARAMYKRKMSPYIYCQRCKRNKLDSFCTKKTMLTFSYRAKRI